MPFCTYIIYVPITGCISPGTDRNQVGPLPMHSYSAGSATRPRGSHLQGRETTFRSRTRTRNRVRPLRVHSPREDGRIRARKGNLQCCGTLNLCITGTSTAAPTCAALSKVTSSQCLSCSLSGSPTAEPTSVLSCSPSASPTLEQSSRRSTTPTSAPSSTPTLRQQTHQLYCPKAAPVFFLF